MQSWPNLLQSSDGSITFVRGTALSLKFTYSGGVYTGRFGAKSTLIHDTTNKKFVLTYPNGEVWTFQDFTQVTNPQGAFISHTTPGGQTMSVTGYTGAGLISSLQRSVTVGANTTTEAFQYAYDGNNRLTTATLQRKVNAGSFQNIRRVQYTYYGSGDANGTLGDLQTAVRSLWNGTGWSTLGTSYYRYWLAGQTNGFEHGLKYVLTETNYARMVTAGSNPLTASNTILAQYADNYFEYDSQRRVTKEVVYGGSQTFTNAYTASSNSPGYNNWSTKTVETLPDSSTVTVYTNYIGQVMLKKLTSGSDSWLEYHQYDSLAHEILSASPSAISSFDDTYANLNVSLKTSAGLIQTTDYYTTGAIGFKKSTAVKQGTSGTPAPQQAWEYTSQTVGSDTVYQISKSTVYRNDNGTGAIDTTYAYTWYSGTFQIQQVTTTLPVVSTGQNGSGVAATTKAYYDANGYQTWSMDERGYITRMVYDIPTGALVQLINDVDTATATGVPSGWTTPAGGGLNLITDYQYDSMGRNTQTLGPTHTIDIGGVATAIRRASWTVYDESSNGNTVRTAQGYATGSSPSYTYTLINPVSITIQAFNGKVLQKIQATRASTSGALLPSDTFAQSSYTRWTTYQYSDCCNLASQRVYFSISLSHYNETAYGYDAMMRQIRTLKADQTILRSVFNSRGQLASSWMGTDDTGATPSDPTGGGASGNNMVVLAASQYDGGVSGGDGNLTQQTQYVNATETRVTSYQYDFRGRRTVIDGEIDYYQVTTYDNLNRAVQVDRLNTNSSGNLIARSAPNYDNRGQVYQSISYAVNPSTGSVGNALTSNTWYDASGNVIKSRPAGSKLFSKSTYDSLGRRTVQYRGYDLAETTYAEASTVTGDTILAQSESTYDNASNVIQSVSRSRYHDAPATQTGALQNPSTTPKARVLYSATYPDAIGRNQASANYGTNGGSALSRSSTIPTRSDTILVTSQSYDNAGNVQLSTDPAGTVTKSQYDDAGRIIIKIENYIASSSSSSSGSCQASDDTNITTSWTYWYDVGVQTLSVLNASTGTQLTDYEYGTTLSDNDVASNSLLRFIYYPGSTRGPNDSVWLFYNRQLELRGKLDLNRSIHGIDFDKLGRQTQDWLSIGSPGSDSSVKRIQTSYDVLGRVEKVTSYDNHTVGSGSIVNEVQSQYNDFGQVIAEYQSHTGAVNTSTTPKVQYAYANGATNTIRPTSMTYPNGRVLTYSYGTTNGIDDCASRIISTIDSDGSSTHLVDYSYLGMSSFVIADYTQPDNKWTLVDLAGSNDPDTGDIYSGYDRFGRVKDNRWYDYGSSVDNDRIKYGYDRASSRLWRQNTVANALSKPFDELYKYDGVHRLKEMQRGTLNGTHTSISSKSYAECWSLDETGNWKKYLEDTNGDGTWDLNQARTSNESNEITDITETAGTSWAAPAYDIAVAGNMTSIPKPTALTGTYTAVYDNWNRLMKLSDGVSTVAEYQYDGLNRRILKKKYVSGTLNETRDVYFSTKWQVLEERVGGSSNAERQCVWGLRYIDDLILRDRDTDGNGTLDERLYSLQDANWNVTALTNTSGDIQERFVYEAYGQTLDLNANFTTYSGTDYKWESRFTGRELDLETQLQSSRNRYYHQQLGCWITKDPIGYKSKDYNLYLMASANPLTNVDPTGKCSQSPDYCGAEYRNVFVDFLNYAHTLIKDYATKHPESTGPIDGFFFLVEYADSTDFEPSTSSVNCKPSAACDQAFTMCGRCVRKTFMNNVLYGFLARGMNVPIGEAALGANVVNIWVHHESEGCEQRFEYMFGYKLWDIIESPDGPFDVLNETDLCSLFVDYPLCIPGPFKHCTPCPDISTTPPFKRFIADPIPLKDPPWKYGV